MRVLINHVACDYLTLSTWNYEALKSLSHWMVETKMQGAKLRTGYSPPGMGQYRGNIYEMDGAFFYGSGEQEGQIHHVMYAHGAVAQDLLELCVDEHKTAEFFRCTRIDIQRTLKRPSGWSQFTRLCELKERGRHVVRWEESRGERWGSLATVYIGGMKSARFARLYEKIVDKEVYLRCEVEFKKNGGSDTLFRRMLDDGQNGGIWSIEYSLSGAFMGFVNGIKNEAISQLFEVDVDPALPRCYKGSGKTAEWLLSAVLPAFTRVINEHDMDDAAHAVLEQFAWAIERQRRYGKRP